MIISSTESLQMLMRWRLKTLLLPQVHAVLDAVFEPTLSMISQDFTEWPEHRSGFFQLLKAIDRFCFAGMIFAFF
jgi:exportin-1